MHRLHSTRSRTSLKRQKKRVALRSLPCGLEQSGRSGVPGSNSMTDAETSGHWVLTSTFMSSEPQATIWEPLKSRPESVETAFIKACGPRSVITQVTGVQKDGWRCGYICLYWFLFQCILPTGLRTPGAVRPWSTSSRLGKCVVAFVESARYASGFH